MATLSEYGVRAMFESEDSLPKDSPFHVFSRICSPVSKPDPKVRNAEGAMLNEILTADHIHFTGENMALSNSFPAIRKCMRLPWG